MTDRAAVHSDSTATTRLLADRPLVLGVHMQMRHLMATHTRAFGVATSWPTFECKWDTHFWWGSNATDGIL